MAILITPFPTFLSTPNDKRAEEEFGPVMDYLRKERPGRYFAKLRLEAGFSKRPAVVVRELCSRTRDYSPVPPNSYGMIFDKDKDGLVNLMLSSGRWFFDRTGFVELMQSGVAPHCGVYARADVRFYARKTPFDPLPCRVADIVYRYDAGLGRDVSVRSYDPTIISTKKLEELAGITR